MVKVLDKPWLDLTTPMGKGLLAFMSALAEDERERINRRAKEGLAIAHANGVKFGPQAETVYASAKGSIEAACRWRQCSGDWQRHGCGAYDDFKAMEVTRKCQFYAQSSCPATLDRKPIDDSTASNFAPVRRLGVPFQCISI